ncbi:murein DD-endopeptidase MepM/ murein hydrolase activator NlpD [Marmoricola sp. URHA0025 HA25]
MLCTLAVAGPAIPLAHADDLHDKKHKVQQGIKSALGDLDDSSKALTAATAQLTAAKAKLTDAERTLAATEGQLTAAQVLDAQMQAKLAAAEQELAQAQAEVAKGQAAVTSQRADIGRLVAGDYQYGDPRLLGLSMVLTAKSPDELASQLGTVDSLMDRESGMYDHLKATEAMLRTQESKVAAAKKEVAQQRAAAAANLVRRQALEQTAAANRAQVAALVTQRSQAAVQARKVRKHDARKLQQLKKEEARIKKLILARAKKHHGAGYSGDNGGFLMRPVPGEITSPFGWRIHPIYGYWGLHDGDDFSAPCGTPERASAGGTVISEYYSSVWGNRLLLDVGNVNGKSMTLIYNHISSYRVRTGAQVGRGDVVALAGTTGWSTGCHLHFTVMLNGVAVDPVQFF